MEISGSMAEMKISPPPASTMSRSRLSLRSIKLRVSGRKTGTGNRDYYPESRHQYEDWVASKSKEATLQSLELFRIAAAEWEIQKLAQTVPVVIRATVFWVGVWRWAMAWCCTHRMRNITSLRLVIVAVMCFLVADVTTEKNCHTTEIDQVIQKLKRQSCKIPSYSI